MPSIFFLCFFSLTHLSHVYTWQSVMNLFSGEGGNEEKGKEDLGFEGRVIGLGISGLRDSIVSRSSLRLFDTGDENGLVDVIFGGLVSKPSVSSVTSSSSSNANVLQISSSIWKGVLVCCLSTGLLLRRLSSSSMASDASVHLAHLLLKSSGQS